VNGEQLIVADRRPALRVLEARDPSALREIGALDTKRFVLGVSVWEGRAYLAARDAGVRVVDVTNPARPRAVGRVDTPGEAWDVEVTGNLLYVADGSAGLRILTRSATR
jgi:hypothetical protein